MHPAQPEPAVKQADGGKAKSHRIHGRTASKGRRRAGRFPVGGMATEPRHQSKHTLRHSGVVCTAVRRTCQEPFSFRCLTYGSRAGRLGRFGGLGNAHQDAPRLGAGRANIGCDPTVASAPVARSPRGALSLKGPAGSGRVAVRRSRVRS